MRFFAANRMRKSYRRGSALILALVLTIALFIMGLAFVSTTQIQKETIKYVGERQTLETAVDAVVGQINTVLVDDLFGDDSDMLNKDASDENWDYPGPDDPWLASLEPMLLWNNGTPNNDTDDWYAWKHISDIYDNNFGAPKTTPYFYDPDDETDSSQWATDSFFLVSPYNLIAKIISSDDRVSVIEEGALIWDEDYLWYFGARADADGDGVADSRWVKVPNLTGPRGQNVYTAVRIIDNGGMININTAYRYPDPSDPDFPVTAGNPVWDGSRLSHINLEGVNKGSDKVWDFQWLRFGGAQTNTVSTIPGSPPYLDENNYNSDKQYDNDVSQRILNPAVITIGPDVYHYTPLDIMDELELKNRGFIDSPTVCRLESLWTQTFLPGYPNNHLKTPYDDYAQLPAWFVKASDGSSGYYTRRHICTTYNFDRVMVPKPDEDWSTISMPTDLKTAWESWTEWNLSSDKWSYRPVWLNDDFGASDPKTLAAAIWLGLPKNADLITNSQMVELTWTGTNERDRLACQLAVNMIDYIDNDSDITKLTVGSDDYYGYESQWGNVFITRVGVTKYDPTPLDGIGIVQHYAIVLHNPGPSDVSLDGWNIYNQDQSATYNIPAGSTVDAGGGVFVLIDGDDVSGRGFQASDFLNVAVATGGLIFNDDDVLVLLDNQGRPCDKVIVKNMGVANPTAADTREVWHSADRTGVKYIGFDPGKIYVWANDLPNWNGPVVGAAGIVETPSALPAAKVTADIQTNTLDSGEIKNVAELYKSLMIGAMKFSSDYITMSECWDKFIQAGGAGDIAAEDIHKGRPDAADPCFVALSRYLTVFHPFSDSVDNDGNRKSDNPAGDGVDNDGDGFVDAADPENNETFANFGEKSELAVAGRININTAPWFVIAQLPWVQDPSLSSTTSPDKENKVKLAQAIVAYRDMAADPAGEINYSVQSTNPKWNGALWVGANSDNANKPRKFGMGLQDGDPDVREEIGFANIAELLNVTHNLNSGPGSITYAEAEYYDIRRYGRDKKTGSPKNNNESVPHDPDPGPFFDEDDAANDLEERDVIFQRISNLVTVRSDVFTAYIMVRVGEVGPQKRVIAIFDRSNVYKSGDTPKLVALHPVPDPR